MHYARWQRHGHPELSKRGQASPEERFWRFVDRNHPSGCWVWTGNTQHNGYGRFGISYGVGAAAHRFSYEMHVGAIPDGMIIMHMCDNRRCVNPDHLRPGTAADNTRDMINKGRAWFNRVA